MDLRSRSENPTFAGCELCFQDVRPRISPSSVCNARLISSPWPLLATGLTKRSSTKNDGRKFRCNARLSPRSLFSNIHQANKTRRPAVTQVFIRGRKRLRNDPLDCHKFKMRVLRRHQYECLVLACSLVVENSRAERTAGPRQYFPPRNWEPSSLQRVNQPIT